VKSIPIELQAHKDLPVTTLCRLLRIVWKDGTEFGLTNFDQDITFNAGAGALLYRCLYGFGISRIASSAGTGVDNAELQGVLVALAALGIPEAVVRGGKLDFADAWCYEINYNDLTDGRCEIIGRGKVGEVTIEGEGIRLEFRSLSQLLKQNTTRLTSVRCNARYGDARCGATLAWTTSTITSVDVDEPRRIFTDSSAIGDTDFTVPGVIEILDGDNDGAEVEVEEFDSATGEFVLAREFYYLLTNGTGYRRRIDCPKDPAGCADPRRDRWPLNYRGLHLMPLDREGELITPGGSG